MRTFGTIEEIRDANGASGLFFFSEGALRFFDSRIGRRVYGGRFFVTSERFSEEAARLYTVRVACEDGSIEDASPFQAFTTGSDAAREAERLAAIGPDDVDVVGLQLAGEARS